jgi:hypothetical protein
MKRYILSLGASLEHTPDHPERTAHRDVGRGLDMDVAFQVWPNRQSMARSIRIQERAGVGSLCGPRGLWHACQPLTPGEGY